MARDDLLNVVRDVDAADVQRAVLAHETADAAHVVAVVAVLVAPEAVDVGVEHVEDSRQPMQVLAFVTLGAQTACEEQAEETPRRLVGRRPTRVVADVAA